MEGHGYVQFAFGLDRAYVTADQDAPVRILQLIQDDGRTARMLSNVRFDLHTPLEDSVFTVSISVLLFCADYFFVGFFLIFVLTLNRYGFPSPATSVTDQLPRACEIL